MSLIFVKYMNASPLILPHKLRNVVRSLHHASERNELKLFVAEGVRVCRDLQHSRMQIESVVVADNASDATVKLAMELTGKSATLYEATPTDMAIMSDSTTPQDILAVVAFKEEQPLGSRVVVLDGVSDPGNVGSIIRSAAWFGFSDVLLGKGCADVYNTKVVRSAAGALFRMNVVRGLDVVSTLQSELAAYTTAAAVLVGGEPPESLHNAEQLCLVIGSEAHGVSERVLDACTLRITIPGGNGTESLNAAIAASLLMYEASRS
ncbi:MAG: RNA methyltransferase [bacterium]|nr:RNA methyltransferase [bacterium]